MNAEPDRLERIDRRRLDPGGMLALVERSPDQWARALERAPSCPAPSIDASDVRAVIVAGMGGSGIAGDVATVASRETGGVTVLTAKGYELPAESGPDTLVVVVSHSGETPEALACYEHAAAVDAPRYVITSGGRLLERAERDGVPRVLVPGGGQPRAHLADLAVPLLVMLDRCELLPSGTMIEQLGTVADHLRPLVARWGGDHPVADNPVKQAAIALADLVPVFYGARGWPALAAGRARCQVNENAERPAFSATAPELAHNAIAGWWSAPAMSRSFALVSVRSRLDEHPRVSRLLDEVEELLSDRLGAVRTVTTDGPSPLARFAAAVAHLDLLSVYLALLGGVDPTPIIPIDRLKRRLVER